MKDSKFQNWCARRWSIELFSLLVPVIQSITHRSQRNIRYGSNTCFMYKRWILIHNGSGIIQRRCQKKIVTWIQYKDKRRRDSYKIGWYSDCPILLRKVGNANHVEPFFRNESPKDVQHQTEMRNQPKNETVNGSVWRGNGTGLARPTISQPH